MTKARKARERRLTKRMRLAVKRRNAERIKRWGVTHLGYAIYGDAYDPEKHGTPY